MSNLYFTTDAVNNKCILFFHRCETKYGFTTFVITIIIFFFLFFLMNYQPISNLKNTNVLFSSNSINNTETESNTDAT